MRRQIILDTGPLIALIDQKDQHHTWVTQKLANIKPPLITCEAVLSEAFFLLQRARLGVMTLKELLDAQHIRVDFQFDQEVQQVTELLLRYESIPMDFADACLVRMLELFPNSPVLTIDSDFQIYRTNGNQMISTIAPWN